MNKRWDIRKYLLLSQVVNGTISLEVNEIITENIKSKSNTNSNSSLGSLNIQKDFELITIYSKQR